MFVWLNIKSLSVAGTDVSVASEPVRNLGAMFDSLLIMAPHVKSVVKKSSFHLRNIGKARRVLTEDATKTVMQSLVMSRLDYCNALLIGIQQDLIAKLQRLQNSAARIVSRTRKYEHITPVLIKLHWLPIKFRIQFKVLLLVYKALNGLAPKYIKELLVPYKPRRHLRSEAKGLPDEPRSRLKFGDRVFSISAPRLWNALPQHLKDSTSCQAFKKCLKTHLFRLAHWGVVDYDSNYDNVQRFWTFYEWKRRYINSNYYYYYYDVLISFVLWRTVNKHTIQWKNIYFLIVFVPALMTEGQKAFPQTAHCLWRVLRFDPPWGMWRSYQWLGFRPELWFPPPLKTG